MPTAAYCDQCQSNVYVETDGRCPQGHGPEHLSGHYEAGTAAASAPIPPAQRGSTKVARYALLIILIVVLLAIGCGFFACTALLEDDDTDVVLDESVATEPGPGPSEAATATADWFPDGAVEIEFVIALTEIELAAFEAMGQMEAAYPAENDSDVALAEGSLETIEAAYADAQALDVPVKYMAIHDYFIAGLDHYTQAAHIMAEYDFAQLEGEPYDEAADLLDQAQDEFLQMLDAIEALEIVWGTD